MTTPRKTQMTVDFSRVLEARLARTLGNRKARFKAVKIDKILGIKPENKWLIRRLLKLTADGLLVRENKRWWAPVKARPPQAYATSLGIELLNPPPSAREKVLDKYPSFFSDIVPEKKTGPAPESLVDILGQGRKARAYDRFVQLYGRADVARALNVREDQLP